MRCEYLRYPCLLPSFFSNISEIFQGQKSQKIPALYNRKTSISVLQKIRIYSGIHCRILRDKHNISYHNVFGLNPAERLLQAGLLIACLGRSMKEPAYQHQPQGARDSYEYREQTEGYKKKDDLLPIIRCPSGCIKKVICSFPEICPYNPSSVHLCYPSKDKQCNAHYGLPVFCCYK